MKRYEVQYHRSLVRHQNSDYSSRLLTHQGFSLPIRECVDVIVHPRFFTLLRIVVCPEQYSVWVGIANGYAWIERPRIPPGRQTKSIHLADH